MTSQWKLKRTAQCRKCPWIVGIDPRDIPNGYCESKHAALASTIAQPGDISALGLPMSVMACHETEDAHCVGWLANQLGPGNNIPLRMRMLSCQNIGSLRLRGEQHACFEDTLPAPQRGLRAFHVDDETIYAALDAEQAAVLYEQDTGASCEDPDYPRELTPAELDAAIPELDENERMTGQETSLRAILDACTEPGMIACNL